MEDFDNRIGQLDLNLFRHIPSQTTAHDKVSLLALQASVRQARSQYSWLEIGSHLGGSLQALVLDSRCKQIVSIDPRPSVQPDARGVNFSYVNNSTQRMIDLLRNIPGAEVDKIRTIDAGTDTLQPAAIPIQPDVCFIDGEHTDLAVLRDARFCLAVVAPDGCIAFHDAQIVYRGLRQFLEELKAAGYVFRAYNLPDSVFVIEFGDSRLSTSLAIREMLDNNHVGYLWSLMENDPYRSACNWPIIRLVIWLNRNIQRVARRLRSR